MMMGLTVKLRPITEQDLGFLAKVYASTRQEEVAKTGWSQPQIDEFLAMQFKAQHTFYQEQFANADFDIVEADGKDIGRLYLDHREDEIRIVDIALLPECRGTGIGTRLLNDILNTATKRNVLVRIHVEKNNPALSLYKRLGFNQIEDQGVYLLMEKTPTKIAAAS